LQRKSLLILDQIVVMNSFITFEIELILVLTFFFSSLFHSHNNMIIQSPEIEHIELTAEDLFLVVACDGLWDVIDPELATRIVLQQIQLHGRGEIGAERAAEELQELAYRLASSDNITVLVIMFTPLQVTR
jgi:serine/threonine protein phosphatase PrpC